MSRWYMGFSVAATVFAAAVAACSLLPAMADLPDAVLLLAPAPAIVAVLWNWQAIGFPPRSLPLWTRVLWFAGLAGALLLGIGGIGGSYAVGDGRAEIAQFAPGWAFAGFWFGYNAVLSAWAELREAQPHN